MTRDTKVMLGAMAGFSIGQAIYYGIAVHLNPALWSMPTTLAFDCVERVFFACAGMVCYRLVLPLNRPHLLEPEE